jgi:neurabin
MVQALDVVHWSVTDVCTWLSSLGLGKYTAEFTINKIDGHNLLIIDGTKLKVGLPSSTMLLHHSLLLQSIGMQNHSERALIKKRVKDLRSRIEKERKAIEKETRKKR